MQSQPSPTLMNTSPDRELTTSRLLAASPSAVFLAYSEPERLARWWGPSGFTNTFHIFEFQPGGKWRYDMHGPDGATYPNESRFEEVSPERIILRHLSQGHQFTLTMTMTPEGNSTRITWVMAFDTVAECETARAYCPRCNEENLDRLESELARLTVGERELVSPRVNPQMPTNEHLLLIRGTHWNHGMSPAELQRVMTDFYAWVEGLEQSGVHRGAQPLMEEGKVVSGANGNSVTDGVFAESKEAIAGYFLLAVKDMEEAVRIAQACPILAQGARIEVRPVADLCRPMAEVKSIS